MDKVFFQLFTRNNKSVARMVPAALALDNLTAIRQENFKIEFKDGIYDIEKKFKSVWDFDCEQLYLLGDYDYAERVEAVERARQLLKNNDIYSFESFNCEHFTNYCFTGENVSFQTVNRGMRDVKAAIADGVLDAAKKAPQVLYEKVIHSVPVGIVKTVASSASSTALQKAVTIGTKPFASGAIGAIVQVPLEVYHLTKSGLEMKKAVKEGRINQSEMDKEVTKRTFASFTSIAGNLGAGVAGAAIGTAIVPGVGTVVGAIIGGTIGELAGKPVGTLIGKGLYEAQSKIKDKIQKKKNKKKPTHSYDSDNSDDD